jgi:CheY-like chemotaxis protein
MNGYDVCREIRRKLDEARGPRPLMIALTGYDQEEDRRRSREAGFDHHLVKPLDYQTLTALLNQHSQEASAGGGRA